MSNIYRITRRAAGGAAGAPSTLLNGQLAYNEQDNTLYYGTGISTGVTAAQIIAIGGKGGFLDLTSAQNVGGAKTFIGAIDITGGSLVVPTVSGSDNSTKAATTAWVRTYSQPVSAALSAFAALGSTGLLVQTGTNTYAQRAITSANTGRIVVTNGDGVSGAPTIDLGTLTVGGLGATSNITKVTVDTYGRVTSTAQMTLSDAAVPTGDIAFGGFKLTGLGAGVANNDAVNIGQLNAAIQGLSPKAPVLMATTANITLSGEQTIDGVATSASRVLVKNQSTPAQNGIYVSAAGAWSRSSDMNTWANIPAGYVIVEQGTTQADTSWLVTSDPGGTLGTTAITWAQFTGAANVTVNSPLAIAGNVISLNYSTGLTTSGGNLVVSSQLAALNSAGTGMLAVTAAGVIASRTATGSTGLTVTNGDGVAGNPIFTLAAPLQYIASVTPATNSLIYYNTSTSASVLAMGAAGMSLIAATSASAAQTILGLGTMATQNANAVNITGGTIDGITLDGGTF